MIVTEFYGFRNDGAKLARTIDSVKGSDGNPLRDLDGKLVPTGFKIQKVVIAWNGKRYAQGAPYAEAVDLAERPYNYVYEPTNIPIDSSVSDAISNND